MLLETTEMTLAPTSFLCIKHKSHNRSVTINPAAIVAIEAIETGSEITLLDGSIVECSATPQQLLARMSVSTTYIEVDYVG